MLSRMRVKNVGQFGKKLGVALGRKFQTLSLRFDGWNVGRDGVTLYKEEESNYLQGNCGIFLRCASWKSFLSRRRKNYNFSSIVEAE